MTVVIVIIAVLLLVAVVTAASTVHILREYERAVVFRLGRLSELQGPGIVVLAPFVNRVQRVSLRTVTLQVPPQEVITRDNIPARVTAVTYYRVIDPNKSVVEIQDVESATSQIAQTTLRSVLGKVELDTLLAEREKLNEDLQQIIDAQTEPWGVKVTMVEIKDVEIPEAMQHSIARQAEAERERRAKVIDAEGEFQAAARLLEAADLISQNPVTIQLRYLQTLRELGGNKNNTVVFPFPVDLLKTVERTLKHRTGQSDTPDDDAPAVTELVAKALADGAQVAALDPAVSDKTAEIGPAPAEQKPGLSGNGVAAMTDGPSQS
jgi:regulator of protease activity HflC (stomatin/prohibitin superfamily)